MNHPPSLTFFVELDPPQLAALFSDPALIERLQFLGAHLSIGLKDLSPERAQVIQTLNQTGIPVTAWLLLPNSQGYWFNLDNIDFAEQRYQEFLDWTAAYELKWERVGLDIEPDIRIIQSYKQGLWAGLRFSFEKLRSRKGTAEAAYRYKALVRKIRSDGYSVESYQMPKIQDARSVGSNLLEKLVGTVDLPVDEEILMTYSSFDRPYGPAQVWNYGRTAKALGLGSTGGGVDLEGVADTRPLSWEELENDLLLSHQLGAKIYIFSLEGCMAEGYLDRILAMDWNRLPRRIAHQRFVALQSKLLRAGMYILSRPWMVVAFLGLLLISRRRKKCC